MTLLPEDQQQHLHHCQNPTSHTVNLYVQATLHMVCLLESHPYAPIGPNCFTTSNLRIKDVDVLLPVLAMKVILLLLPSVVSTLT
jgi:hypothetical protein